MRDLAKHFDARSIARGRSYADSDMVGSYDWISGDRVLTGVCQGSGGMAYETEIRFTGPPSMHTFATATCTCPVGLHCKHAVALLIVVAAEAAWVAEPRRVAQQYRHLQPVPAAPPAPAWRQLLAGVAEPSGTATAPTTGAPLALSFSVSETSRWAPTPYLMCRPMVRGRQGKWIKTGGSWRDVLQAYGSALDPVHTRSLQALHHALTGHAYASSNDQISVSAAPKGVWAGLRSVREAGVELVIGHMPGVSTVQLSEAMLRYDIDAHGDGAAMTSQIAVDGLPSGTPIGGFIGREAHTGLWAVADGTLTLAAFDPPLTRAETELLSRPDPVQIPAADLDEFALEMLPRIQSRRPVAVADGVLTPPEVSGPYAVLTVGEAGGTYRYGWSIGYDVNDRRHVFDPVQSTGVSSYRDAVVEAELWEKVREPLVWVIDCVGGWFDSAWRTWSAEMRARPTSQAQEILAAFEQARLAEGDTDVLPARVLATAAPITPVDAAILAVSVLPDLADNDHIIVDNQVDTEFRQLDDTPSIAFTADDETGNDWFGLAITVTVGDYEVPLARLISELASGTSHLLLDDGAYFSLDSPELARLAELITEARSLGEIESGKVNARSMNATLWDELLELGVVDKQLEQWRKQMAKLAALTPPKRVACPRTVKANLRDYQRDGLDWLAFLSDNEIGGILADDMGLGKTLQTLAMIARAAKTTPDVRYLVIAPTSVVPNWVAECRKFAPSLTVSSITSTPSRSGVPVEEAAADAHIVVTSYTLLRILFDDLDQLDWDGIIFDEAQFIKNHAGKTHQAARRLEAASKFAITGTPMENNLMELWALLSVTAPGLFPSPKAFTDFYRKPIESGTHPERMEVLRRRIKPVMLRRKKEQVALDLPAKQEQVLALDLGSKHRKIYDTRLTRERQKVLGLLGDWEKNRFQVFRSLSLLRQLSLHAGLVDETHHNVGSAKIEYLMEALPELVAEGHSALVFSQYTSFLDIIRTHLDAAGIAYSYLDGTMTAGGRAAAVEEFTSGQTQVFLISLKAGGFGLNLTEADYCFVCDPWWNPAAEAQAVDRAHRIGQQRPVTVCRLVSANTIEERVVALQDRKRALFDAAIDDGELFGSAITAADIREMLG